MEPVVNGTANIGATSGGQIDITKPAGIQNGDFLFLVISGNNSGTTLPNLTDENTGKEWTILDDRSEASVMRTWILGRIADNEPATWNFALDLDTVGFVAVLAAYRGVHATTWEDVESAYDFNVDPSNVSDCPSLTPVSAGAFSICVGLIDNVSASLSSGPAGYTERVKQDTGRDAVIFDQEIVTPAATGAKQITWSSSDDTQGFHFILRPAVVVEPATWKAAQDANITLAPGDTARLRVLVNAVGDPASMQPRLEYRKQGEVDWFPVEEP